MNKFAFILHPLNIQDVTRKYKLAEKVPPKIVAQLLKRRRPFVLSEITGITSKTGASVEGCFIGVPLLPWQILELEEEWVVKKIVKGCRIAEKQGAQIVGLGAFTALVGENGKEIARNSDIAVTTGNTYTIATAIQGAKKAAKIMDIEIDSAKLAVVGATGSIGKVCAKIMAPSFAETLLVGRDLQSLTNVKDEIGLDKVSISNDVSSAIKDADVIITVTSSVDVIIHPEDIKSGAVVCDVARPRDVSPRVAEARNDVLVIDGGIVKIPGADVNFNFNFGLPEGHSEACMAETIILALDNKLEDYTIGKDIQIDKVIEIENLAQKHGFEVAGFRRFERPVTEEQIQEIKENSEARKG